MRFAIQTRKLAAGASSCDGVALTDGKASGKNIAIAGRVAAREPFRKTKAAGVRAQGERSPEAGSAGSGGAAGPEGGSGGCKACARRHSASATGSGSILRSRRHRRSSPRRCSSR